MKRDPRCQTLLDLVQRGLSKKAHTSKQVSNVWLGVRDLGLSAQEEPAFFQALEWASLDVLPAFNAQDIANMLNACAKLNHNLNLSSQPSGQEENLWLGPGVRTR